MQGIAYLYFHNVIVCKVFSEVPAYFTLKIIPEKDHMDITIYKWGDASCSYKVQCWLMTALEPNRVPQLSVQDSSSIWCPLFVLHWWSPLPHPHGQDNLQRGHELNNSTPYPYRMVSEWVPNSSLPFPCVIHWPRSTWWEMLWGRTQGIWGPGA